jgi:uncharacterized membrane protein
LYREDGTPDMPTNREAQSRASRLPRRKNPYLNPHQQNELHKATTEYGRFCPVRKGSLAIVILISLALMTTPAWSQSVLSQVDDVLLDPVNITAEMSLQGVTVITFEALLTNLDSADMSSFSFRVDSLEANVLSASVNGTAAGAYATQLDRYTEITVSFSTPVLPGERVWLSVRVRALDLQSEPFAGASPGTLIADFIFYVRPLNEYHNFTFAATLPEEALLSEESLDPLFPDSGSNSTDGRSLSFVWFTSSLQPGQERVFIVKYQFPCTESGPFPGSPLLLWFGIGIGILVGAAIAVFGPRLMQRVRKIGRVRFVGVTTEEEEILDIIRAKGGKCLQKALYTDMDMSQAKVSLILTNLEERGLVRRFREGRENVVHIMEE